MSNTKKTKQKSTIKRNNFYYRLLRPLIVLFVKIKFGYKYKKIKNLKQKAGGNYIVLSNHTTDYDMLFTACSFKQPMYFVASEHISRWGKLYKFLDYCFAPIMRYKGSVASSTVMEVLRRTRKGSNVCIFAEGVRSWDGETNEILSSTAKLVKSSNCALVTYKIVGGYMVSPNWSRKSLRKGPISGAPVNIYTKEQLASMTDEEVYNIIKTDLYENACERQLNTLKPYKGKNLAEQLEYLMFKCSNCNATDSLKSKGDTVTCNSCGKTFKYSKYGMLVGCKYTTTHEYNTWQKEQVKLDVSNNVTYSATSGVVSSIDKHTKTTITTGTININTEGISCNDFNIPLNNITDMAIYGRNGIVFTAEGKYYEILPDEYINGLKFLYYYKEYINQSKNK